MWQRRLCPTGLWGVLARSSGHLEEEVEAQEEEDKVGGPGGEDWGELADAAHGFHESGNGPVRNADAHAEGDAADSTTTADENGEGDREHHADGCDEGVGEFFVPLDGKGGDVEAGAVQSFDIVAEVAPTHLESLDDFAMEVGGGLGEFGKTLDLEGLVASDSTVGEVAHPAGFENPRVFGVEPTGARGEDTAFHLEGGGVELDDTETAEEFFVGIEEVVIVDLEIFTEDPALRAGVGLGRLAFNLVAECVLTLIGVGKVDVVENEKARSKRDPGKEKRNGEAIEADAAGFEGDDFVVFAEDAEGNENGDESAEWRKLIDEIGDEVAEIVDDDEERHVVTGNVVEEFEEGEDLEEEDEGGHDDEEVIEETAEEVEVDDGREARGGFRDSGKAPVGNAGCAGDGREGPDFDALTAEQAPESGKTGNGGDGSTLAAVAFHAREKSEAGKSEDDVGSPHPRGGRDNALASEAGTDDEEKIVSGDDDDGEEGAGGASSATRLSAERDGDESKDEAGDGKSKTLVKFDAGLAPIFGAFVEEIGEGALGIAENALGGGTRGGDFDGPVGALKNGDGIVVRIGARVFVSRAAVEVELQLALVGVGNYNGTFRESNLRAAFSAGLSEKDAVPACATGRDIVNVEDHVGKALVEDAWLHLK